VTRAVEVIERIQGDGLNGGEAGLRRSPLHQDKLVTDGRKVMKSLRYSHMDEIDGEVVVELLKEAKSVNHKGFYKN